MSSRTRYDGPQSAPSGGRGMSTGSAGSFSGTNMVNASHWPSGDQVSDPGPSVSFVSFAVWPVSIHRTQISEPPSSDETYASRSPLGDQRGEPWPALPVVSGRRSDPSTFRIHRSDVPRSVMMS